MRKMGQREVHVTAIFGKSKARSALVRRHARAAAHFREFLQSIHPRALSVAPRNVVRVECLVPPTAHISARS